MDQWRKSGVDTGSGPHTNLAKLTLASMDDVTWSPLEFGLKHARIYAHVTDHLSTFKDLKMACLNFPRMPIFPQSIKKKKISVTKKLDTITFVTVRKVPNLYDIMRNLTNHYFYYFVIATSTILLYTLCANEMFSVL